MWIDRLQVNYGNPLLYPVSVSDCTSPERVVFCISIVDLISKSAVVLFTLLCARKNHFEKAPYYSLLYYVQDYTHSIIGYCNSIAKIVRLSDLYWFYFHFREMEQKRVKCVLLSIGLRWKSFFLCFILKFHISFFSHKSRISDFLGFSVTSFQISQRIT